MIDEEPVCSAVNPNRVGIYLNSLEHIIADLNGDPELQKILGVPVSAALVLVADNNDLRIEEGGRVQLTELQTRTFLSVLDRVINANAA